MKVNEIRRQFLQYFKDQGHTILPSSPLVPHNDPTLMFTNAGMVQFKYFFTGAETPEHRRVSTSQKCVRAGGKHNDLDNVGYTARHHTFFEMLGNFSFGDYFKEQAISYTWELLTKDFGLSKEKLYITVYHEDDEAFDLWHKLTGFSDDRILRIKTSDNFWTMGDTGPCGPCTEVFYDHGEHIPGGLPGTKDQDGDRYVEIWNLVFMQYETLASGETIDLPKPSVDTGMGLERIAAVLQGVTDNYDIDLFQNLIEASMHIAKKEEPLTSHRIIADHLRSSCFLIADGVMPANEGRGYVLRRIMRRAMRHAYQLGCKEPLMHQLVPTLVHEMGEAYPELLRAEALTKDVLLSEEERFRKTLGKGLGLLKGETASLKEGDELPGEVAFKLYDTYGFPLDLTTDILRQEKLHVDQQGFDQAMEQQRKRARAAWEGSGEKATAACWFPLYERLGGTEFLGYETDKAQAEVLAIVVDGKETTCLKEGQKGAVLLNQTPFYAESGGQVGDQGEFFSEVLHARVLDTEKQHGSLHVHHVEVEKGTLSVGDTLTASIAHTRREKLRANHSATHLLHHVLREVLGEHVVQKGSLVAPDRLRLDVAHPKAMTTEALQRIEREVNEIIRQNDLVTTSLMSTDDAIKKGALALFGEKYGDEVRVISMGPSTELCGGTHVKRTGDIGYFKITQETAIAAGIRRIEALTGDKAVCYVQQHDTILQKISELIRTGFHELEGRISELMQGKKKAEKELARYRLNAAINAPTLIHETVQGVTLIGKVVEDISGSEIRSVLDHLKQEISSGVVMVGSRTEDKAMIMVALTEDMTQHFDAKELILEAAPLIGAKGGGGKKDFAQTGGSSPGKLEEALRAISKKVERSLETT